MATVEEKRLSQALEFFDQGNLAAAKTICLELDAASVGDCAHLNLLGLIALRESHTEQAINYFKRAAAAEQDNPLFLANLGVAYHALRNLTAAEENLLGALEIEEESPEVWNNLANIYDEQGKPEKAVPCYEKALTLAEDYFEAWKNYGTHLEKNNKTGAAKQAFLKALALEPSSWDLYFRIGGIDFTNGDWEAARVAFMKTIQLNPKCAEACFRLGVIEQSKDKFDQAIIWYQTAIELGFEFAPLFGNLGMAYLSKHNYVEAERMLRKGLEMKPDFVEALNNMGLCNRDQGHLEQARDYFNQTIAVAPNYSQARVNLGMLDLLCGRLEEGWSGYEWRLACPTWKATKYPQPYWRGEDLNGKSILFCGEQGLGDSIQFVRYAAELKKLGAHVICLVHPALVSLFRGVEGIDEVIPRTSKIPDTDYYVYMLSLPTVLGPGLRREPSRLPYLKVDSRKQEVWKRELSNLKGKKVGLCWKGNPHTGHDALRSISLPHFHRLLDVPGVHWISLQKDGGPDIQALNWGQKILDRSAEFHDLVDTAALIQELDLVISVDTSIVHLAGALNKPVWTLIQQTPDWRWGLNVRESPWYPSVKLFRQKTLLEWRPELNQVREELSKF